MKISRRGIIILVGIATLLVIVTATVLLDKNQDISDGEYLDPWTNQTVSNPKGKAPDIYGGPSDQPVYLGAESLIDRGMTIDQLNNLKSAIYQYSKKQSKMIKEVSIDVEHITTERSQPGDLNSPLAVFFNVRFDRQSVYQAKVEYPGISEVRLYLLDSTNKQVLFDSEGVDVQGAE